MSSQFTIYTINFYFIDVHSPKYRVAVLHKNVSLAFLTGDSNLHFTIYSTFVVCIYRILYIDSMSIN